MQGHDRALGHGREPRARSPARRLISSDYAQVVLLGSILESLGARAPSVSFNVTAPSSDPLEALAAGEADLFFGPALVQPWCESERLLADPWVCVRRRGESLPTNLAEYLALEHVDVVIEGSFGAPIARRSAVDRPRGGSGWS